MRRELSPFSSIGHASVQGFVLFLVCIVAVAVSGEAFAETCVNAQIAEVCMEPAEVAKLVDPIALRRMFIAKVPAFKKSFLEKRKAVGHPQALALAGKWNKIAAEVLKSPGDRVDFYRSVFDDLALQGLIKIRIEVRPALRISGLPNLPRASFTAAGLSDLFQAVGNTELSQADFEPLAAAMNSSLEAEGATQIGKTYNMIPILAEFVYQLRFIYREMNKQVVVFEDEPGGSSPEVDLMGTLYVPKSFFDRYDPTEQELVLVHESTHLILPSGKRLMQLLTNRLNAMGPMAPIMGAPDFKQKLQKIDVDMESEHDANVLLYLRSWPDLRRRYQALIQRLEPGSQRAAIISFLNQHIDAGDWPRPPARLHLHELTPVLQAQARYESLPDGSEKVEALTRVCELTLTTLPKQEQDFYRPLYQLMVKQYVQNPEKLIVGAGLRPKLDDKEMLEEGLSAIFKEVLDRWEH